MYWCLIFLYFCALGAKTETTVSSRYNESESDIREMNYEEGLNVEHKYVMPSVNASALSDSEMGFNTVPASLSRVLDFYNTELLAANWKRVKKNLTPDCKNDVQQYINGLSVGDYWALKMDDASGRYSTGWFWGNHYWTGSQSLCENIAPIDNMLLEKLNTSNIRNEDMSKKPVSPDQAFGYKQSGLLYTSVPPYPVGFFMLRLNINSTFTTEERIVHVGLCLPLKCTDTDVQIIMEGTSKASLSVSVKVEAVRSQHQRFDIWKDTTFWILLVVSGWVVVLLIGGTTYDFYLQQLKIRRKMHTLNCTYTNGGSTINDKAVKLDISVTDVKSYNGKTGFYMVNNKSIASTETNDTNNNNNSSDQSLETVASSAQEYPKIKLDKQFMLCLVKRLLLAFSIRVNVKNIFDQNVGSDTIPVIHGLKSISMAWVILGHTCIVAFKYSDNMEYRKVVQQEFIFQTITNGTFSVDTFFFASGLLVSFLYFRTNAKGKLDHPIITKRTNRFTSGIVHFVGLLLYRFARLTAPYLFALGIVEVSMKWFNYNSVFEPPTLDHVNCPKYWWRNILYINTLFPVEEMCMLWSWYLSDDTQFYVVGAVLLILATSHFKSAASLLLIFTISSWLTTGYIAFSNSHMPGSDDPLALFDKIYDKPWTRLGPYLIGMSIGWLLFKTNCKIRMSKLTVIVGWLLSAACLLSLVYGLYNVDLSPFTGAAYSSLSHSAWALSLAWIVVACSTGHGGYVNSLLSATVLYPFSRVTYCAYLLHPVVIRVMAMSMDHPLHLGKGVMVMIFLGQVVASYTLSFIISISFESPVVSMLRILTRLTPNYKNDK